MKNFIMAIAALVLLTAAPAWAQDDKVQEFRRQEEQRRKSELMRQLDSGVYFMDNGQYLMADEKFRHVLENVKSVPSDLTFFFGKNSFHLERYKQSIDWLNKYIQLKGTTGQYYEEAIQWLEKAQASYVKEKAGESQKAGEILSSSYDIDCGPSGKVSCPVCKGTHVVIRKGPFGNEYKTCVYCNEHGVLTCDQYNKLLRGQLQPKQ